MLITISLIATCYHADLLQFYQLYSLCHALHSCGIYLISGGFFILIPLISFACSTNPLPSGNHWFVSMSLFLFCCFSDSIYVKLYDICLSYIFHLYISITPSIFHICEIIQYLSFLYISLIY